MYLYISPDFAGPLSSQDAIVLRSALDGALDRDAAERMIHVAAATGKMPLLRLCVANQEAWN